MLRDAIAYFEKQAEQWKQKQPMNEIRGRMHYEAAWGYRLLAEPEVAAAREKMQQEQAKKMQEEAVKKDPKSSAAGGWRLAGRGAVRRCRSSHRRKRRGNNMPR